MRIYNVLYQTARKAWVEIVCSVHVSLEIFFILLFLAVFLVAGCSLTTLAIISLEDWVLFSFSMTRR